MTSISDRLIGRIYAISHDMGGHADDFDLYLKSLSRSEQTRNSYLQAVRQISAYLEPKYEPLKLEKITRRDARSFLVWLQGHKSKATVANRARSLKVFFDWAVLDDMIDQSPLKGFVVSPAPVKEVPVISERDLRELLATCKSGKNIWDHRDYAIFRIFIGSGARRSEVANLTLDDIDIATGLIRLMGKGSRPRVIAMDKATQTALRKYLRARSLQPGAHLERLWLSVTGAALTDWGVESMLHRRCREAGIPKFNLHRFRHTFAHMAMERGLSEGDIMRIAGWKTRSMLDRYGASRATDRALAAQKAFFETFDF